MAKGLSSGKATKSKTKVKTRKLNKKSVNPDREKQNANLIPFANGPDPRRNTAGRPRQALSIVKEQTDLTFDDIKKVILSLMTCTEQELTKIYMDDDAPMYEKLIARSIAKDFINGRLDNWEIVMDRVFGKSIAYIDEPPEGGIIETYRIPVPQIQDEEVVVIDEDDETEAHI